jgi:vacuolar-type H+-ATPase subunit H
MEYLVNKIVEIDRHAAERLETAGKQKEQIIKQSMEEARVIKNQYEQNALKQIHEAEESNKEVLDKDIKKIVELGKHEIVKMQEEFDLKHKSIEECIFKRIVGE